MYMINEYMCDRGHVVKNIQYDDGRFCHVCFREWQEKTFPVVSTQEPVDLKKVER